MDLGIFIKMIALLFNVLAWPSVTLMYPLYASIRAIEGDAPFKYQQCLTYWVLFSITTIMESAFAKLIIWLPFWPYAKGIVTFLMAVHHFGGASYVYLRFVRPYTFVTSRLCDFLFMPEAQGAYSREPNDIIEAPERYSKQNGPEELEKHVVYESESKHNHGRERSFLTCPASPKKVQQEWSCAICVVNTTSEEDLKNHLQGKKHKAMEKELMRDEIVMHNLVETSFMMNLESWSYLISPVARSITWCTWRKPKSGWMKLNTDGSIDRKNSSFGGLFRDHNGDAVCGYVSKYPCDDIFLVELWAIWRGLVLALNLGIEVLWIESDAMSVVKSINREQPCRPKAASSYLEHVWKLLKKFKQYKVSHSWRETNRAADHLAKMDLLGLDVVIWPTDFPERLCNIIKEDAQGKRYRRS